MNSIPGFFTPTKVLLVDDDRSFLNSVSTALSTNTSTYSLFDDPVQALTLINEEPQNSFGEFSSEEIDHVRVDYDIQDIHTEAYNHKRFDRISVIIVDYDMPEMNGIEFCKKIKNNKIQKIMLTGEADESIAIKAFNDGVISKFVKKGGRATFEELNQAIFDCQMKYFQGLTLQAVEAITKSSSDHEPTAINYPEYKELVHSQLKNGEACEFYLIELTGSFLFIDSKGVAKCIFIRNQDQMDTIADEAQAAGDLTSGVKKELADRKQILCYSPQANESLPDFSEWEKFLRPSVRLDEYGHFYYALTDEFSAIGENKILSYETYFSR